MIAMDIHEAIFAITSMEAEHRQEVLHRIVPMLHEPDEVNASQGDVMEIPPQTVEV